MNTINIPIEVNTNDVSLLNELREKLTQYAKSLVKASTTKTPTAESHKDLSILDGLLSGCSQSAEELRTEYLEERYGI